MSRRVLTDLQGIYKLNIIEGQQGGKLVVEGKIGHCDVPTANGRIYPRSVMEREINRLKPRIEQVSVYSVVDHPTDGKTRLKESGAIVRDLWIEPSGEIRGRFEVVEEAPAGQALAAFLRRGASVGMSSRGMGSTTTGSNGNDVVGEDFRLNTWDFVSDPACHDAYPAIVAEAIEGEKLTQDYLRARHPKLVQSIEEQAYKVAQLVVEEDSKGRLLAEAEENAIEAVKLVEPKLREELKAEVYAEVRKEMAEDFAVKLVRALAEMKASVTEEIRSEMASDPELAGAKFTLKKIAEMINPYKPTVDVQKSLDERQKVINDRDKKLAEAQAALKLEQERCGSLDRKGQLLVYALHIEQRLAGRPDAEVVRNLIGKTESIKSAKELDTKITAAVAEADKTLAHAQKRAEEATAELRAEAEERAQTAERRAAQVVAREAKLRESIEQQVVNIEARLKTALAERDAKLADAQKKIEEQQKLLSNMNTQAAKSTLVTFTEERVIGHPRAAQIINEVKTGKLATREQINSRATKLESAGAEPGGVSERVRRAMSQGRETFTEEERVRAEAVEVEAMSLNDGSEAASDLAEIGTSLVEQTNLAKGPHRAPGI